MHHPEGWPEPGPSVGREAVLRQFEQLREAWTDDRLDLVTGQGPDADMNFTRVFTVRERKLVDIDMLWDHAKALKAAGLSE